MKDNRKIIPIIFSLIILLLIGVSFSLWKYRFIGEQNLIKNESIELEFLESSNEIISMKNAIPISDETGKNQAEYFAI